MLYTSDEGTGTISCGPGEFITVSVLSPKKGEGYDYYGDLRRSNEEKKYLDKKNVKSGYDLGSTNRYKTKKGSEKESTSKEGSKKKGFFSKFKSFFKLPLLSDEDFFGKDPFENSVPLFFENNLLEEMELQVKDYLLE